MKLFEKLILILILILAFSSQISAQSIDVTLNGNPVQFSGTQPIVVQGRVLVPLRGVLEEMGANVDWNAETQTVFARKNDKSIQLPIGSLTATINGQTVKLDVPAKVIGGSTMVPLRFLSEALGATVSWDNASRTVIITSPLSVPTIE